MHSGAHDNPFDRLHATGLILQSLLGGVAGILAGVLVLGTARLTENSMLSFGFFYAGMAAVILARVQAAHVDLDRLFGPVPNVAALRLAWVAPALGILSIAGFWLLFFPVSIVAPRFVQHWALDAGTRDTATTMPQWFGQFFIAVLVAPVVEELLFRGLLLHRWADKWNTRTAVIVSSALFAIGHVELLGHFLFGVTMCALYLRTRSLWVPIATHALNNFLASIFALPPLLRGAAPDQQMTLASFRENWWAGPVLLAVGAGALELYRRRFWRDVKLTVLLSGPTPYPPAPPAPLPEVS